LDCGRIEFSDRAPCALARLQRSHANTLELKAGHHATGFATEASMAYARQLAEALR
jgi:hypothetical protein